MNDYIKQAEQFLADTGTTLDVVYLYTGPYFSDDDMHRDIYQFTLKNLRGTYTAKFGDSIHNTQRRVFASNPDNKFDVEHNPEARHLGFKTRADVIAAMDEKPSAYDILVGLQKYDAGTFADFCSEFEYNTDSIKAQKIYFAVQEEWQGVCRLFTTEQLEQLQDIQ